MQVSLNWLKDYLQISHSPEEIADELTSLGLEATYHSTGISFTDVVVGRVVDCSKHPNADKLFLCRVDIGDGETHAIVCGAPNVKKGIHVPVAKIGATMLNGEFKIKKTKLRGETSHGMICSGKELQINDDHEGILILDTDAALGTAIEEVLDFTDNTVFELDLTPNRGDCLSHLGVARELGLIENQQVERQHVKLKESSDSAEEAIKIVIHDADACPRYAARVIKGIKVGPSPGWLAERLQSVGLKSIYNIVDAANYVLMDSGHPMHTFNLARISGNEINVRMAKEGEKFTTLDEVERNLKDFHLLICDGEKSVALAGIMGGSNSEIDENTADILIESAYFEPTVIRKGAKYFDLSTEASKRFERDTDIENVILALDQLAALIVEVAGGTILKGVVDAYPREKTQKTVDFSLDKCSKFLGIDLSDTDISNAFGLLNIEFTNSKDQYKCTIPTFRNDLEREVDLFEEIARIIGYDNIPASNRFTGSFQSFVKDEQEIDSALKTFLKANGFQEHYSNSLMTKKFTEIFKGGNAIELKNPLSRDMAFIRNSIFPGLLTAAAYNEKRQQKGFNLYELGAVHFENKKSPTGSKEKFKLGLLWYGDSELHWRNGSPQDIFSVKGDIALVLNLAGFTNVKYEYSQEQGFHTSLKILVGKTPLGFMGIPTSDVLKEFDLNLPPFICEINMSSLRDLWQNRNFRYETQTQFPGIRRDIAIQVKDGISADELFTTIRRVGKPLLKKVSLFDLYQSDDMEEQEKSMAFALNFQSETKTLQDGDVDKILGGILESLKKEHGAVQR